MKISKVTVAIIAAMSLGFLLISLKFSIQPADTVLSYAMGGIVGACIMSAIAGYIAYAAGKKNSRAANIAVSAVFILALGVQINLIFQRSHLTPQDRLKKVVASANKSLPKKIDDVTELQSVSYNQADNQMVYQYVLTDASFVVNEDVTKAMTDLAVKAFAGGTAALKTVVDESAASVYWSYAQNGKEVMRIKVH